jgi:hypothetical protein
MPSGKIHDSDANRGWAARSAHHTAAPLRANSCLNFRFTSAVQVKTPALYRLPKRLKVQRAFHAIFVLVRAL